MDSNRKVDRASLLLLLLLLLEIDFSLFIRRPVGKGGERCVGGVRVVVRGVGEGGGNGHGRGNEGGRTYFFHGSVAIPVKKHKKIDEASIESQGSLIDFSTRVDRSIEP